MSQAQLVEAATQSSRQSADMATLLDLSQTQQQVRAAVEGLG